MTTVLHSRKLSFEAEVVEVFERDGRRFAKLLVHSFFLETDAAEVPGAHLGDRITFIADAASDAVPASQTRRSK